MLFQFKEFDSLEEYNRWLSLMGERVRVVGMKTLRSRWTLVNGYVRPKDSPSYLVTYKEVGVENPLQTEPRCQKCGTLNPPNFKFCGNCGAPMQNSE